jgi:hypothetical protein
LAGTIVSDAVWAIIGAVMEFDAGGTGSASAVSAACDAEFSRFDLMPASAVLYAKATDSPWLIGGARNRAILPLAMCSVDWCKAPAAIRV